MLQQDDMHTDKPTRDDMRTIIAGTLGISPAEITDEQLEEYSILLQLELQAESALHVRFEHQADQTPQALAITAINISANGEQHALHLTYQELNEQANRLAWALKERLRPGSIVGIGMERSVDQVLAILSVLKAGAAYALIDLHNPVQRRQRLLEQASVSIMLIKSDSEKLFSKEYVPVVTLEQLKQEATSQPVHNVPFQGSSTDVASVRADQGISIDHQSLLKRIDRMQQAFELTEADGLLGTAPLPDLIVIEVLWPLLYGARAILLPSKAPHRLLQAIEQYAGTVLSCIPSAMMTFGSLLSNAQTRSTPLPIRMALCSGEPLAPPLIREGGRLSEIPLYHLYQSREMGIEILAHEYPEAVDGQAGNWQVLPGISAYVLDKDGQIAPFGATGVIYVSEDAFSTWEQNREMLQVTKNPVGADMLVATTYLGRQLNTDQIEVVASTKEVAWIDGYALFLPEIQRALQTDPSVDDCALLARRSKPAGTQLVAYVVPALSSFSQEHLHLRLQSLFPPFMLPQTYVPVTRLPFTPSGRLDEHALLQVAVPDRDLLRDCEWQLRSLEEIKYAAAVIQPYQESPTLLHRADILPSEQTSPLTRKTENAPALSSPVVGTVPFAIAHGAPLQQTSDLSLILSDSLLRAVRLFPYQSIVYITPHGEKRVQSFPELLQEASCILAGLRSKGLKPQDKVIFQLEQNWDIVPAFWACILGGFIPTILAIPPTYEEPNNALEKLVHAYGLLDQPLLLTSYALRQAVDVLAEPSSERLCDSAFIEDLRLHPPDPTYYPARPDDIALFSLTSGSTGIPKCIMLSHHQLLTRARATNQSGFNDRTAQDIILNWLPFDHIGAISDHHIRCVDQGCQMVYVPTAAVLQRPLFWMDLIDTYRCTHSWAPNFAYALLVDAVKQQSGARWDLSCVKSLLTAGESVSAQVVEQFLEAFAPYGLKKTVMQPTFGMAELCSGIAYFLPTEESPIRVYSVDKRTLHDSLTFVGPDHPHKISFTALGRAIPGCSMRIVDENGSVLPENTIGRLQVKGTFVFSGYYKRPELNREVFTPDGWFHTGDLGFLSDGNLVITGREKEVIIIRGVNHFNYEIEEVVQTVEGVAKSYTAACAIRDAETAAERLAIFFASVHTNDWELVAQIREIKQRVSRKVGTAPDYVIPVEMEDIPKTTIGKIQRSQLARQFESGKFADRVKQVDLLLGNENTLPDWFYRKVWRRREEGTGTGALTDCIAPLIFLDQEGLGTAIATTFAEKAICVRPGPDFTREGRRSFRMNPRTPTHYRQLLDCLAEDRVTPDVVLHLWTYSLSTSSFDLGDEMEQTLFDGAYSLLFLLQAWEQAFHDHSPLLLIVASSQVHLIAAEDTVSCAKAPLLGILKAAGQEFAWLRCRHIDLPPDENETNKKRLLRELGVFSHEREVAYRHGMRFVARLEKRDFLRRLAEPLPFHHGAMYVISGGLGGIGVEVARYLLTNFHAKVLLLGRSELPARSSWHEYTDQDHPLAQRIQAFQELEQLGGEVRYETVDVCDVTDVLRIGNQIAVNWKQPIAGVIHLAGMFHERPLSGEAPESLSLLLQPKLLGTFALYQLVKDQPGSLFITFSSLTGFFGGAMVGAYAAANCCIEAFAASLQQQKAVQSYCLAWSLWKGVGIGRSFESEELLEAKGYAAISAEAGIASLLVALCYREQHLLIGVDASKPHTRRSIENIPLPLYKIVGYFTPRTDQLSIERLYHTVTLTDRFQTRCPYALQLIQDMPLRETGEPDYERLMERGAQTRSPVSKHVAPRTDTERRLAQVWQEVLGIRYVSIHDNLFELGGDSLHMTQIVAKLRNIGLTVTVKQLFQHSTVADLAQHIREGSSAVIAEQDAIEGDIPLTPAEHTFFEKDLANPHFFNQAYLFEPKQPMAARFVEQAIAYLLTHHDALRLRFQRTVFGWQQRNAIQELTNCFTLIDLSHQPKPAQTSALERHVAQAHTSLNLSQGPLIRVVLFDLGGGQSRLLFVLHHLVTDPVSWRILLEDFLTVYQQLATHAQPQLPPKTSSFRAFAQRLVNAASSAEIQNERWYWLQQPWSRVKPLPFPSPEASNKEGLAQVVIQALPEHETQMLLRQVVGIYGATIQELLLTALTEAITAWAGEGFLQVELTHHGRDPLFEDLDVSRTLGWFSIAFPVLIERQPAKTLRERVVQIQKRVRTVPNHGYSYGLLRYLCPENTIKEQMKCIPPSEVLFNYLGQMDHVLTESSFLKSAQASKSSIHDPEGERLYKLVFNGRLVRGQLEVLCVYGQQLIEKSRIDAIITHMVATLKAMIAECATAEQARLAPVRRAKEGNAQ